MTEASTPPTNNVSAEVMTITPEDAKELLDRNTRNRRISPAWVKKLADDMVAGRWDLNGESIKIDWDDTIEDGQHRLLACVESNTPFTTVVIFGIDPETRATIDTGKKRTLRDYLDWAGVPSASDLAAAIGMAWKIENNSVVLNQAPSHQQAITWYEENPGVDFAIPLARRIRRGTGITRSICAAVLYLAHKHGAHRDEVESFAEEVSTGFGLEPGSASYALRRWADNENRSTSRRSSMANTTAIVIKGWNAWYENRSVKTLYWRHGGKSQAEPFPIIAPAAMPNRRRSRRPSAPPRASSVAKRLHAEAMNRGATS